MLPTALLPFRKKVCSGLFFALKIRRFRPGANPRIWVPKASTLPLDHRNRQVDPLDFLLQKFVITENIMKTLYNSVHQNDKTDAAFNSFYFLSNYLLNMFRVTSAHHQEFSLLYIQPPVICVAACPWHCLFANYQKLHHFVILLNCTEMHGTKNIKFALYNLYFSKQISQIP
jgi:hypothetical protein